jgi:hypothetical protein
MPQLPDIHTWDEDFLQSLPGGETSYIDYKDSRWLTLDEDWRQKISTYLSAFANYDGGYLIIGVLDPEKTGAATPDGGVDNSVRGGLVQWLQNVVPGLVERPLDRIDIWPIGPKGPESAIRPGHSVLVIHVAPSEGAPHQARDGKYYGRRGSSRYVLGHRAIMDIAGRRKHPNVKVLNIALTWTPRDEFILTAAVENTSTILARFCSLVVDLPVYVGSEAVLSYKGVISTTDDGFHVVRVNLNNSRGGPLFPLSRNIFTAKLEVAIRPAEEMPTISDVRYKLFADEMPFLEDSLPLDKVLVRQQ